MSPLTIKAENKEFVLARLRLAQALLEESDQLGGMDSHETDDLRWFHPRHEREALVAYLLLTCFDRLGQDKHFLTLSDWLKSVKDRHSSERADVLENLGANVTHLDASRALADRYQLLYGVRNAFCNGIYNLSPELQQNLFDSVTLVHSPDHGKYGPNVSVPGYPIEDKVLEKSLKVSYLFGRRNRFTHRLEQYQSSSTPVLSNFRGSNGASWAVEIRDSTLQYWGVHHEHVPSKSGGVYGYSIRDWPFVLFDVLYAAIGIAFERTSIKLMFQVLFFNSASQSKVGRLARVEHQLLKDYHSLEKAFWADPAS